MKMNEYDNDVPFEVEQTIEEELATPAETAAEAEDYAGEEDNAESEEMITAINELKATASEDDVRMPPGTATLRKILGGDILSNKLVRGQIWLIILVVAFCIAYVAIRYQCQQDLIEIDKLKNELQDAKYRALSSSSNLTEKCRESRIMEQLKASPDSMLTTSKQPPYKIIIPEEE